MKKSILMGSMLLMAFSMVEVANASLVKFDLAGGTGGSSVAVSEGVKWAKLSGALAPGLDAQVFSLNDGETKAVDFFTLTASGFGGGNYQVMATLAFDLPTPMDAAVANGQGKFGTFFGFLSGGTLSWISQPADFVLGDGNKISVDFEDGFKIGLGNKAMIHAYITNQGGGVADIGDETGGTNPTNAPVPEPATMFLFGTGLVSFAGLTLNRKRK